MNFRIVLAVGLCALLAACGVPRLGGSSAIAVAAPDNLPPPTRADLVADNRPYLIGPFDKLTIGVFGVEELKQEDVQADASGRISVPLAGVVMAAGHTTAEVADVITARLKRYVRDPQVTVNLKETVSQVVTVDGQVQKPGLYPVIGRMTLLRAVATAGGLSEFARLNDVVVFRTVNQQQMAALFNLRDIRRGRYDDPQVYANDVVLVGDSTSAHVIKDVLQLAPALFTTAAVLVR